MVLWLELSRDKYELPLIVADSAAELARKAGVKPNTVFQYIFRYRNGLIKYERFCKVEVED